MLEKNNEAEKLYTTGLVIEDERPLLFAIKTKLEKSGFDVATARTVEQAWNYLEEVGEFDFLWVDHYLLGQESGLDFVKQLRAKDKWKNVPIFVVSNTASTEKIEKYGELGITKYYTKADNRLDRIIADIKEYLLANQMAKRQKS